MSRKLLLPAIFAALAVLAFTKAQQDTVQGDFSFGGGPLPSAITERIRAKSVLPPEAEGNFPGKWINGDDCDNEPPIQVHAYNEDFYILRQSKCEIFEAPFMFLIFGEDTALLMDTGALNTTPVRQIVDGVISDWLAAKGRRSIDLIVAHTHGHFDHVQGDGQFPASPYVVQIVDAAIGEALPFWGLEDYPLDVSTIDLGGRVLDVIGTPGHHPVSVTLYDRRTQILMTGDIVYPGHLFVFSQPQWQDFRKSLRRLTLFAAANPVTWVLGCHIETSEDPFGSFAYGTTVHPNEHRLQFKPTILSTIYDAANSFLASPQCTIFEEFVIHPVYLCGIGWNG